MEQHRQQHTSLWSNTDNTILLYGETQTHTILLYGVTQTTPYFCMEQHGQHHEQFRQHCTSLWSNTDNTILVSDNTILLYGATQTTLYFSVEQYGQHHNSLWSNTDNSNKFMATQTIPTILFYENIIVVTWLNNMHQVTHHPISLCTKSSSL